jgi:hypothetical protein
LSAEFLRNLAQCAVRSVLSLIRGDSFGVQAFLGIAFAAEGLLFGFHLKGTPLDWSLHFLLVVLVFAASLVCFGEYR